MNVAVIGAGPAGLAAALRLHRTGHRPIILEASPIPGGHSRSLDLWGHPVELSAHIFWPTDTFVADLWREFVTDPVEVPLVRALLVPGGAIPYPLTATRVARAMPCSTLIPAIGHAGLARARRAARAEAASKDGDDAETWMVGRYGRPLHDFLFRDYAEKLFGLPCDQIASDFPETLFASAADTQGAPQTFVHPRAGLGSVWSRMVDHLGAEGVEVRFAEPVQAIEVARGRVAWVATESGSVEVDAIVSTAPIGALSRMLFTGTPYEADVGELIGRLKVRSTVLVYLLADRASDSSHWLALYPASFRFGRVTEFASSPQAKTTTVFCLEAWCDAGDDFWQTPDEELVAQAADELRRCGQFGNVTVLDQHVERVAATHPSYAIDSVAAASALSQRIREVDGIASVGRGGGHSVFGMAESMAAARQAADSLRPSTQATALGQIPQL